MNKQIDLSSIPKRGKLYDWKNSIGVKCNFTYNDISGEIEIVDYTYKYVTIKYKDKTDKFTTDSFVRCSLGKVLGVILK